MPPGFDPLLFEKLPPNHEFCALRLTLDALPDEQKILQSGHDLSRKQSERANQLARGQPPSAHEGVPLRPAADKVRFALCTGHVAFRNRTTRLADLIEAAGDFFGEPCQSQDDYLYPRTGFRTWHTNKFDSPGWRMCVIDVNRPGRSYFRIQHPGTGELLAYRDKPGTINFFRIDPERPLRHCIRSLEANRWEKGSVVPDDWKQKVLGRRVISRSCQCAAILLITFSAPARS